MKIPISEAYGRTMSWLHDNKVPLSKPEKSDQIIAYYTKPLRWTGETVGLVRFNFSESSEGTVVDVDFPIYHKISDLDQSEVIQMQDYLPEFFRMYRSHMGIGIDEKWLSKMYLEDRRRALAAMQRNSAFVLVGLGVFSLLLVFFTINGRVDPRIGFPDVLFLIVSIVLFFAGFFKYWKYRNDTILRAEKEQ